MTQPTSVSPVSHILSDMGVPHREFQHQGPISSLEQAAEQRGQRPSQVVRSLLFRLEGGKFVMVLVAGASQLSWKKLRQALGVSRVTMASEDEMLQLTGYVRGAVAPFGIGPAVSIMVDASVLAEEEVSIGSGVRGVAIILATKKLMDALGDPSIVYL